MCVNFQISLGNGWLPSLCSTGNPGEGGGSQLRSGIPLLWHSGRPFGVPDVGNEIIHAYTVTKCPSGTQEPCLIGAHRRELTIVMAFHKQSCSQPEKDFGMITTIFHSLPFQLASLQTYCPPLHTHTHTHTPLNFFKTQEPGRKKKKGWGGPSSERQHFFFPESLKEKFPLTAKSLPTTSLSTLLSLCPPC